MVPWYYCISVGGFDSAFDYGQVNDGRTCRFLPRETDLRRSATLAAREHEISNERWCDDMAKTITRVQTGLRLEKRILKVLKGLAEYLDMSMGDLVEGMALHCFEGKAPPFNKATLVKIDQLKQVYDLDLTSADSHKLIEKGEQP